MSPHRIGTRRRFTGERGIAIIMTALLLLPLMAFAAFGVDLASWYARISYLQKSADAAALAGTVWLLEPGLGQATDEACASLRQNGITGGDCEGPDDFEVTVERGSTATALRVTVTDPHAQRFFSGALFDYDQRLTRSAEAEYNLALPLGSPFNYFGGDPNDPDLGPIAPALDPIDRSGRSGNFWAAIAGPESGARQGDAYSTRCVGDAGGCAIENRNRMYLEPTNVDRGYWYVIRIPAGLTGSVDLNVFDAGRSDFPTQFQVWEQTNPRDFSSRIPFFDGEPDTTEGSCNWRVGQEGEFENVWKRLCTLTAVAQDETYLLNVQSVGLSGAGTNEYALEAVANGGTGIQPSMHAFTSMAIQNQNRCSPVFPGCTAPPSTFYLAEVGPQFAGRTLVVDLWDAGDVSGGATATVFPMMPDTPSTAPGPIHGPGAVIPVPEDICTYTADNSPNGTDVTGPNGSDTDDDCGVETSVAGTQRFNGQWLRIRIEIPTDYTCTVGVNPQVAGGSCWWGMRYVFVGGEANDFTTWQARIEGNPVRLTR